MDLPEFLLARIAEDEAVARELLARDYAAEFRHRGSAAVTWHNSDYGEEGVSLSPARVLAECEAKRRIVRQLQHILRYGVDDNVDAARLLRLLALPYADHPDYREEWKP